MYPTCGTLLSKYTYSYYFLFKERIPQFKSIQINSNQFKSIQINSNQFKSIQINSNQFKAFIVFNLYSVTVTTKIFVNLPVKDLNKTIDFFNKLGFKFNPQFTDENATCMIVGEDIFVMLLVEKFFKTFTKKEISDTSKNTEVIVALSVEGREKVDQMINNAIKAGGRESREPQDHGWMYGRSFEDIDGHLSEIIYMDESAMKNGGKPS
jgi:uncharacterized protein